MKPKYTGYCENISFKAGQSVVLPKGTLVKDRKGLRALTRAQTVKIDHTLPGASACVGYKVRENGEYHLFFPTGGMKHEIAKIYGTTDLNALKDKIGEYDGGVSYVNLFLPIQNPVIRWAGRGGYWVECDINQIS